MGKYRNRNVYSETTDRRTFNIIHIKCVTSCCLKCAKRERRNDYYIRKHGEKIKTKYPSWKLVSKNKKQWMDKNLIYDELKFKKYHLTDQYTFIKW